MALLPMPLPRAVSVTYNSSKNAISPWYSKLNKPYAKIDKPCAKVDKAYAKIDKTCTPVK